MNAIEVKNVSKTYELYNHPRDAFVEMVIRKKRHTKKEALKNISFSVKKGECFGVMGANGSGKSTILSIINGTTIQTSGEVFTNGSKSLLNVNAGIVANYTGIENIYYKCGMMGLTKKETEKLFDSIVEFSEIGDYLDQPAKKYSSGMKAKLGFAISVQIRPDILIVDEALSVGDQMFREKCSSKITEMRNNGMTIMYVSHDPGSVESLCDRALWIEGGEMICSGNTNAVCAVYSSFMNNELSLQVIKDKIDKGDYCFD